MARSLALFAATLLAACSAAAGDTGAAERGRVRDNERKVRIEVGYGLEGSFNDVFCKEIIDRTMLPQFRQGDFERGVAGTVDMIVAKMKAVRTIPANDNNAAQPLAKAA